MRILLISSRFYPFTGGVENVVLNLARQFQAKGHEVLVVASRMGAAQRPSETIKASSNGDACVAATTNLPQSSAGPAHIKRIWMNLPRSVLGFLVFPVRFAIGLIGLIGQIRCFQPDVINYHFPDDSSVYVWLAFVKPPLVLNIHGNDLQVFGKRSWYRFFLKRLIQTAKIIIVNSSYIKSELGKDFPEALEKVQIISNGVDEEFFEVAAEPQNYILFLGRLVPKKGVDVLIKAFAKVQNELESNLVIVGDGPERAKLEDMVKNFVAAGPRAAHPEVRRGRATTNQITFTGNQTGQARLDLVRQAKFAVMPSRREPFGIVALELMAAGKAIIVSQTGGLAEIVENGKTGILFENGNVDDLAGKILALEKDSELRKNLGCAAHQEAKKYRWKEIAERYLSVFSI